LSVPAQIELALLHAQIRCAPEMSAVDCLKLERALAVPLFKVPVTAAVWHHQTGAAIRRPAIRPLRESNMFGN
jgi:hypothetical protein